MVILTLSRLREIEDAMLGHCTGAAAEIVIDCNERAVYLQWKFWREIEEKEFAMSLKVRFIDIAHGNFDVLEHEAGAGSRNFARDVAKLLEK